MPGIGIPRSAPLILAMATDLFQVVGLRNIRLLIPQNLRKNQLPPLQEAAGRLCWDSSRRGRQ